MLKKATNKLTGLSAEELITVNGGATGNAGSITMSSSTDSLLSIDFEWHQGDMSRSLKISAGNNIDLNLSAFGNKITR